MVRSTYVTTKNLYTVAVELPGAEYNGMRRRVEAAQSKKSIAEENEDRIANAVKPTQKWIITSVGLFCAWNCLLRRGSEKIENPVQRFRDWLKKKKTFALHHVVNNSDHRR